ncbi:MAG: S41 family peptidase [Bdellovibrionaceae bacterium]|nr:S41 family peptidase [Pseudobdellovibrionaceae bacterium]MDW8190102.1 S41 family peptidase [Pseudobdellovibrionaceae bacterium]
MFVLINLILVTFFSYGQLLSTSSGIQLECQHIFPIQQVFLSQHYGVRELSPEIEMRTIHRYLIRLDPNRMYLLESDRQELEKKLSDIFKKVSKGDCEPLFQARKIIADRLRDRVNFVKKVLNKNFKLDKEVEIDLDRDKAPYPKTKEEAEGILKKYIHLQVANQLLSGNTLEEAKERVVKNWERVLKKQLEMNTEDLVANFLDAFAQSLDPHSTFMARDSSEDFRIHMSLSLEGIGASLSSQDGFTVIENLFPGGPAAKSGLLEVQDRIIAVGQGEDGPMESVVDMDLKDVVRKIRGPKGTKVRLKVLRNLPEGKSTFNITLVRDKIQLDEEGAQIFFQERSVGKKNYKIAIIRLPSFYNDGKSNGRSAAKDVQKLIERANNEKADGLVIDFSSNGGGSLDDAVKIAGLFIATGNIVKQTTKADPMGLKTVLADKDKKVHWTKPVVILVSRLSASASEIVAGALQDYRRAIVVGSEHTFGKGTVQTVIDIPPMSGELGSVKITVGSFYIPGGYSTQHRGVVSDITFPGRFDLEEMSEKDLEYSLPPSKLAPFLSPEAYVKSGSEKWEVVTPEAIKTLVKKSSARVEASAEFKKIRNDLEKMVKNRKKIKIKELMQDPERKEEIAKSKKRLTPQEKDEEYLKRADIQESVNITIDYLTYLAEKS